VWLDSSGLYDTVGAETGTEGERQIRTAQWDIVISDIELPGSSGLELVRLSKELQPYTPTLLITAHESMEYALEAIHGRADAFLLKPLVREAFMLKVAELVERSASERKRRNSVVLAIGAHPDDVEIGCAGILLRHADAGDSVSVLTLCGGENGGTVSERVAEAHRAAEILGARLFIETLRDGAISEGRETISLIEAVIEEVRPSIIYTQSLNDGHQDHRNVHRATIVAARGVPSLYCYQSPSSGIDFRPSKFVEIGDFIDRKVAVIGAYGSQVPKRQYLRESLLRATAEYWGRFTEYGFVEPLEVIREGS
jgi:LmbE family N-acetylglucosaminyl deacetylase